MKSNVLNLHAGSWTAALKVEKKYSISLVIGVWRPEGAVTVMKWLGFSVLLFFFYSEITQRPVNVLKSVSVCIKLLYV